MFHDLGIVEPDDDPLSCLADEENGVGDGPRMRFLVEEVDPKLAVSGLQWSTGKTEHSFFWLLRLQAVRSHVRRNVS